MTARTLSKQQHNRREALLLTRCSLLTGCSLSVCLQENYFLDDGAYGAVKIIIEMVRRRLEGEGDISDLLKDLRWVDFPPLSLSLFVAVCGDVCAVACGAGGATPLLKEWIVEAEVAGTAPSSYTAALLRLPQALGELQLGSGGWLTGCHTPEIA